MKRTLGGCEPRVGTGRSGVQHRGYGRVLSPVSLPSGRIRADGYVRTFRSSIRRLVRASPPFLSLSSLQRLNWRHFRFWLVTNCPRKSKTVLFSLSQTFLPWDWPDGKKKKKKNGLLQLLSQRPCVALVLRAPGRFSLPRQLWNVSSDSV